MKKSKICSAVAAFAACAIATSFMSCKKESAKKAEEDKTIHVFGASRGEEAARLEEIIKEFNAETGFNVVYEGSPEFETPGTVPPPWDWPKGCAFHPRCQKAKPECSSPDFDGVCIAMRGQATASQQENSR